MTAPATYDEHDEHDATTDSPAIDVLFAGDAPPTGPTADDLAADDRFDVTRSADFVDARDRVDRQPVDCVVATHREDGFDGVAFLEAVRQEYAELPVILVPAAVDAAVARRAVDADVTALVPADESDARDSVVEAVESSVATYARERGPRMPISDLTVEAERRLKERALDEAPIGITISDATESDEPVIYINDSFEEITGYSADEAVGVNHRFLQGPETDPDQVAKLSAGIDDQRDTRVVLRNYTRDGELFWNQVDISPIYDENGEVSHYVGFQMDVTERKRAQQQLQAERESLDRLLDRVNGLVNDVTAALVRAASRDEIERLITERVGTGSEYTAAWLGRYDATERRVRVTEQAGDREVDPEPIDLDADAAGVRTLREAVDEGNARVVAEPPGLPDASDDETCVLVPLTYRSTTYGVLGVLDDENFLDDRERVLLGSLGRSVGASINDVLTKRTITTDTVLNIGVELSDDDIFLVDLAAAVDAEFDHETTISNDQNRGVLTLVSTAHDDVDRVVETAERYDDVLAAETIVATDDESVIQFRLARSPLVDVLSEFGSRVTSMHADATTLDLEFRIGTERAARRVLDALRETYDHVELVAYHESDPEQTPHGFREELRNRLTDRQLTALKKAYVSGYFEWPRRAEGKQLAESMDIVPSTYHQHLQAAKQKLVGAFFEE